MLVYLKEWFDIRILNHNRLKITPHVPLQYLFLKIIIFNLIITYYNGPRLFCDIYIRASRRRDICTFNLLSDTLKKLALITIHFFLLFMIISRSSRKEEEE
jgi:hypothetical protein